MTIDLETLEVDRVDHWNFDGKTNRSNGLTDELTDELAAFLRFTDGLNEDQMAAFEGITSTNSKVVILSGSGGTGKTFTLIRILKYFLSLQYSVAAIAPTHKACNVMRAMGAELDAEFCTLSAALSSSRAVMKLARRKHNLTLDRNGHRYMSLMWFGSMNAQ